MRMASAVMHQTFATQPTGRYTDILRVKRAHSSEDQSLRIDNAHGKVQPQRHELLEVMRELTNRRDAGNCGADQFLVIQGGSRADLGGSHDHAVHGGGLTCNLHLGSTARHASRTHRKPAVRGDSALDKVQALWHEYVAIVQDEHAADVRHGADAW